MIRFGICNEMFEGWPVGDVFRCARDEGYEGVEIAPFTLANSVTEIDSATRERLREEAVGAGIEVIGLHWLLVKPEGMYLNHPDPAVLERTLDYLLALIKFCCDLGGHVMVLGSPKQRNVLQGDTFQATFDRTTDTFRRCMDLAAECSVTLCFEPLTPKETNFINTAEEGVRLVEAVGHRNFKLHLDVKAMCSEAMPVAEVVRRNAAHAGHVHANDANLRGPGFGEVDFVPIFRALKETGYAGYVSVEVFDFKPDPVTIARKSLEYMRRSLAAA